MADTSAVLKAWNPQDKLRLIGYAEKEEVLWNVNCTFYRELTLRKMALEKIREKFNREYTVEQISEQYQNLKSVFRKKLSEMRNAEALGEALSEPCWRYFQPLKYLMLCEEARQDKAKSSKELEQLRQLRKERIKAQQAELEVDYFCLSDEEFDEESGGVEEEVEAYNDSESNSGPPTSSPGNGDTSSSTEEKTEKTSSEMMVTRSRARSINKEPISFFDHDESAECCDIKPKGDNERNETSGKESGRNTARSNSSAKSSTNVSARSRKRDRQSVREQVARSNPVEYSSQQNSLPLKMVKMECMEDMDEVELGKPAPPHTGEKSPRKVNPGQALGSTANKTGGGSESSHAQEISTTGWDGRDGAQPARKTLLIRPRDTNNAPYGLRVLTRPPAMMMQGQQLQSAGLKRAAAQVRPVPGGMPRILQRSRLLPQQPGRPTSYRILSLARSNPHWSGEGGSTIESANLEARQGQRNTRQLQDGQLRYALAAARDQAGSKNRGVKVLPHISESDSAKFLLETLGLDHSFVNSHEDSRDGISDNNPKHEPQQAGGGAIAYVREGRPLPLNHSSRLESKPSTSSRKARKEEAAISVYSGIEDANDEDRFLHFGEYVESAVRDISHQSPEMADQLRKDIYKIIAKCQCSLHTRH